MILVMIVIAVTSFVMGMLVRSPERKPLKIWIRLDRDTWLSREITVKEGKELYDASKE